MDNDFQNFDDSLPENFEEPVDTSLPDNESESISDILEPQEQSRSYASEKKDEDGSSKDDVREAYPPYDTFYGPPPQTGYMPYGDRPQSQRTQTGQNPNYFYYYGQGRPMPPHQDHRSFQNREPAKEQAGSKTKKSGINVYFSILAVFVALALVFVSFSLGRIFPKKVAKSPVSGGELTTNVGPSLNLNDTPSHQDSSSKDSLLTSVEVAEKVKPSVIGITVTAPQENSGFFNDQIASEGSGIVMGKDDSGEYTYIVTCAHVIDDDGMNIYVQLEDGTQKEALMVGYDVRTDIGVIKVAMDGLKTAEFGDSGALKVGEQVFAVGNPGGSEFFGSFTSGVVSAIDRPVNSGIGYTMELIQHDAAINPGNSGGALVNGYGQVIGINSQKIIASSYEGMGFAIPIRAAKNIVDSLIKFGYVPDRPKLGITYYSANSNSTYNMIVALKGLPSGTLYINDISPDSDLVNTDARKGDLITAVNGNNLDTANVLLELIDEGKVGDVLELTLCRIDRSYDIKEFKVKVKLVEDKGTPVNEPDGPDPDDYFFDPFGW